MNDKVPNFVGVEGSFEHRTVGPHRAWCHVDAEWCYPDELCDCCHETLGHQKVWVSPEMIEGLRLLARGGWSKQASNALKQLIADLHQESDA